MNTQNTSGQHTKAGIKIFAIFAVMILMLTLCAAESNYDKAIFYSQHTDGSDAEIEQAMFDHGFIVDAYSSEEPSMIEKIIALTR